MDLRSSFNQFLALVIAYGAALALPTIADFILDTHFEWIAVLWLNVGLFVMRVKKIAFPMPKGDRVDMRGGLTILWWALFWPSYLLRR